MIKIKYINEDAFQMLTKADALRAQGWYWWNTSGGPDELVEDIHGPYASARDAELDAISG